VAFIRFDDTDDLIDICLDNVFKAVFTRNTPESQGALSKLLSAVIGRELSVITITANEPPVDNLRDRQIRFDINCKAGDGELLNVEMSLNPDAFEPIRLEFHAGKLFTRSLWDFGEFLHVYAKIPINVAPLGVCKV
jgi:hypothetical protein